MIHNRVLYLLLCAFDHIYMYFAQYKYSIIVIKLLFITVSDKREINCEFLHNVASNK